MGLLRFVLETRSTDRPACLRLVNCPLRILVASIAKAFRLSHLHSPPFEQTMTDSAQPRPLQVGAKGHYIVRMLMVGDSSCGKTSLVLRFDQNVFSTKFVTTIGVDYRDKVVKVS